MTALARLLQKLGDRVVRASGGTTFAKCPAHEDGKASLAIKAVFVILAPFGLVTLVLAVATDMGMSLLVTLNAMRLLGRSSSP